MPNTVILPENMFRALYAASLMLHIAISMTVPFIPLYAGDLGASLVLIGVIVTAKSIGALLMNIPSGLLTSRLSARFLMISGAIGVALSGLLYAFSSNAVMLMAAGFVTGISLSLWSVTRLDLMRHYVSDSSRGGMLANYGGIFRISRIIGPLIGGFLIEFFGYRTLFITTIIFTAAAIAISYAKIPGITSFRPAESTKSAFSSIGTHIKDQRRTITGALVGILGLTIMRSGRSLIIPLWGDYIGITVAKIGLITSLAAAIELLMVLPAGKILDNKGRKWAMVPTMGIMAVGLLLIPLAHSFWLLLLVSAVISIGNGLGSGINMVFSTDLAPKAGSGLFIGVWRSLTNLGMMAGSFAIGLIAQYINLGVSPIIISAVGIVSIWPVVSRYKQIQK